eukprot:365918-Chlamydomonas_euryale.AAC.5
MRRHACTRLGPPTITRTAAGAHACTAGAAGLQIEQRASNSTDPPPFPPAPTHTTQLLRASARCVGNGGAPGGIDVQLVLRKCDRHDADVAHHLKGLQALLHATAAGSEDSSRFGRTTRARSDQSLHPCMILPHNPGDVLLRSWGA